MEREAIEVRVRRAIDERVFPGCVIGIIKSGERLVAPFGKLRYDDAEVATEETVYDVASVTKSIPTASLALSAIKKGALALLDPVKKYIPELENDFGATIEDLLRYRVRGIRMSTLKNRTFEEIRTRALEHGFDGSPKESVYTNLPAFLLGLIVERAAGSSLEALAARDFFEPLNMIHTTFFPDERLTMSFIAPTEIDEKRGEVRGLPHDESAYVFAKARCAVGHAGLFSTAPDMLTFLQALIDGRFPYIVEGARAGLGWQVNEPYFMGAHAVGHAFGKTGFTGCSVLCDTDRGIGLVILSNRTYPKRPADADSLTSAINHFRSDIADIVFTD